MIARLSTIPVIADWSVVSYSNECGRDPPNCHGADQNVGSDATYFQWKDTTVEGED